MGSTSGIFSAPRLDGHWDVVAIQNLQRFLQRLHLIGTLLHAVIVVGARRHARGLELLIVVHCCIELLLCGCKLLPCLRQGLFLTRNLIALPLDVSVLDSDVGLGITRKRLVFFSCRFLRRSSVRLQSGKVGLDHLQHSQDSTGLSLQALVRLGECLRCILRSALHQSCCVLGLVVELLEHSQSVLDGLLGLLSVLDRGLVLGLLGCAVFCGLGPGGLQLRHARLQLLDFHGELGIARGQTVNLGVQLLDLSCLLVSGLLVGRQLGVTPSVVLGLLVGFLLQLDDHVLDHLLHLRERVSTGTVRDSLQQAAARALCGFLEVSHDLVLRGNLGCRSQLQERGALNQAGQVPVGRAADSITAEDINRLTNGLNFFTSQLLASIEVRGLGRAFSLQIGKVLAVGSQVGLLLLLLALSLGNALLLGSLGLSLAIAALGVCLNLIVERLYHLLILILSVQLPLLKLVEIRTELGLQLLQHVHDATSVLDIVSLRRLLMNALGLVGRLLQHGHDHPFRMLWHDLGTCQGQLQQGGVQFVLSSVSLSRQNVESSLDGIVGLRIILESGIKVYLLVPPNLSGCLNVSLMLLHLTVQVLNLPGQCGDIGSEFVNLSRQLGDGVLLLGDGSRL
mmetsp:Transcript_19100/g.42231  ORF Transcript_19100/g.42231 Transcript_19100/m.42231 type:complete len:623 (+) Transcript_19100:55-1923(+)